MLARGWAGPSLLAMVLFEKFGQHQPLNRQAERYAKEGVPISLSTLADQVGGCTAALAPLFKRLEAYVLSAERLHGDDTTVPVLAKGKTDTGRIWVYVRDDKPFGGQAPPGAVFYYSRDRAGEHPQAHLGQLQRIFQADAYGGYGRLYDPGRNAGPILEAACWVHARRPFFVMADLAENARRKAQGKKPAVISPLALETVRRIDALFEIERGINGQSPEGRRAVRQELSAPLVADLETWMRAQRAKLSRGNDVAKAMDYMLKRWTAFTRFLDDGRICLSNNAAERAVRGIALGRKSWLFCGSDRGGERAAVMYSLIVTAKMNDVDPQAWLADVLDPHRRASCPKARRTAAMELAPPKPATLIKQPEYLMTRSRSSPDAYPWTSMCRLYHIALVQQKYVRFTTDSPVNVGHGSSGVGSGGGDSLVDLLLTSPLARRHSLREAERRCLMLVSEIIRIRSVVISTCDRQ